MEESSSQNSSNTKLKAIENHGIDEECKFHHVLVPNQLIGHNLFYTFIKFQELDHVYILFSFKKTLDANLRKVVATSTEGVPTTSEQMVSPLSLSLLKFPHLL